MLDFWTYESPMGAPAVASIADDSRSHLEIRRSSPSFGCCLLVLGIEAAGRHLKATQSEGMCAFPLVLLMQLFS